jgi:hypothetical protein
MALKREKYSRHIMDACFFKNGSNLISPSREKEKLLFQSPENSSFQISSNETSACLSTGFFCRNWIAAGWSEISKQYTTKTIRYESYNYLTVYQQFIWYLCFN